ncbi:MAG: ArgE/DapE family deacylase [Deltaproteobacteria bacterium]|nr:ArgE/DapE family deacylase [Deltaproteobacteria bacterium]
MNGHIAKEKIDKVLNDFIPQVQGLLSEMIRFPSIHGSETGIQRYLERKWTDAGFEVRRHPISETIKADPEYTPVEPDLDFKGRDNLVVRMKGRGQGRGRSVILNSHVDVVPAGQWKGAFEPIVDGQWIYGRGACDAKGCVATMYLVACSLRKLGLPFCGEVIYQMVIDEEVGGNGSLSLIREGIRADGAVVLEPTKLTLHPANRGAIWFRFEFEGKPTHMGRKDQGVSAIDLARETIGILYEYEKELVQDQESQPLFSHYGLPAQVNIGVLTAGEWPSMVAGSAVMEGGIGFLPNRPMSQVKQDVVRYLKEKGSDTLKSRYRLSFPRLHNDSYETPVTDPLVQAFRAAAKATDAQDNIVGWNVSCDARLFAKLAGMPTVVFGPGDIEHAHSSAEKVHLSEIVVAAETLIRFIEKWCGGVA